MLRETCICCANTFPKHCTTIYLDLEENKVYQDGVKHKPCHATFPWHEKLINRRHKYYPFVVRVFVIEGVYAAFLYVDQLY